MNEQSGSLPGRGSRALAVNAPGLLPDLPGMRADTGAPPEGRFNVNELLRIVIRWRWLILGTVLACVLGAVLLSLVMTPVYQASSTLEINREPVQILGGSSRDAEPMQSASPDFLATQVGLLESRSLAEQVARSLNLASNEAFAPEDLSRAERERAAASVLRGGFSVLPARNSRLVRISYEHTNPELAATIVDSYADNFINSNLERRYAANNYARKFLERRIDQTRNRLEQSERKLVGYAQRNDIILLGTGDEEGAQETSLDAASLVQLNEALSEARSDRIAAEQRFRQGQGAAAATGITSNPTIQALTNDRAELQAEYQQKLDQFQPDYPEMRALRPASRR